MVGPVQTPMTTRGDFALVKEETTLRGGVVERGSTRWRVSRLDRSGARPVLVPRSGVRCLDFRDAQRKLRSLSESQK